MNTLRLTAEIKADATPGHITGYASVFGGLDSYDDTIERGAFTSVVASGHLPKMFFNHMTWNSVPIGTWKTWREDDHGLYIEGDINLGLKTGSEVYESIKFGSLDGLSIGYSLGKGDAFTDAAGVRHIKNFQRIHEVSIVTFPADDAARIASVKSSISELGTVRDIENFLRDAGGLSKSDAVAFISTARQIFAKGDPVPDLRKASSRVEDILRKLETVRTSHV